MKAAITTFWDSNDNYGSLLQNYALQKFLNLHGIDTCLICVNFSGESKNFKSLIKSAFKEGGILNVLKKTVLFIPKRIHNRNIVLKNALRKFEEFRAEHLNPTQIYPTVQNLKANPPEADIYITGSDQVWNLFCAPKLYANDFVDLHFLNFGKENVKRIACSVCVCKNEVMDDFKEKLSALIDRFEFVSTREEFGVEWCRKIGYKNAFYQPDPSFLLSLKDWKSLYETDKSFLPNKKFVLIYLLNNDSDVSISKLKHWATKNGLAIIYVSGNELFKTKISFRKKSYATIPQWLELFEKAEYVFTNSFHGTIFSIIYNKKFMTIEQRGKTEYSNSRVYELLAEFDLQNRFFSDDFDAVKNEINYENVNRKIDEIRVISPFVKWVDKIAKTKSEEP